MIKKKTLSYIMIIIYAVWVILPRFHYTVSVVNVALISAGLLFLLCMKDKEYANQVLWVMVGALCLSLMYYLIAYPLDVKQAILTIMTIFMMFVPMFLTIWILRHYSPKEKVIVVVLIATLEVFVGINTLAAIERNPVIVRMLTSGTSEESKDITYKIANIGGYGTAYSFVFFFYFGILGLLKQKKTSMKLLFGSICVFSFMFLLGAQFGTAIMLSIAACVLLVLVRSESTGTKLLSVILAVALGVVLPSLLEMVASLAGAGILSERLLAISGVLTSKTTDDIDLLMRMKLLGEGFMTFFRSPIWGQTISEGGVKVITLYSHSSYLDLACSIGVIGLLIYLKMWSYINGRICIQLEMDNAKLYRVAYWIFVMLGCLNPNWGIYEINIIAFMLIPIGLSLTDESMVRSV